METFSENAMVGEVDPGWLSPCRHSYSLCTLSTCTYNVLKENAAVVNSCLGATGWNILSGWPRDLHVAEIIKTSFNGKTAFVLWRARSVRHAHKPASPTRYLYLGSVNRGAATGPEASGLTAGRRVESWWRLRLWVCSRNTLLCAQSKHIMEMYKVPMICLPDDMIAADFIFYGHSSLRVLPSFFLISHCPTFIRSSN